METWSIVFAAPARRALEGIGIRGPGDAAGHTRYGIENLHGIGGTALKAIEDELRKRGLTFKKEEPSPEVDAYLQDFSGTVRQRLDEMRDIIRRAIPLAKEKMAYGMPTYYYRENVVHFAGFKNHISLFPTPNGIEPFQEDLAGFSRSKGAIQFPLDAELPRELIERIVAHRWQLCGGD